MSGAPRPVFPLDMRCRLGYHGLSTARGSATGRAFGPFGIGGSGAWADSSRELAVTMIVTCGIGNRSGAHGLRGSVPPLSSAPIVEWTGVLLGMALRCESSRGGLVSAEPESGETIGFPTGSSPNDRRVAESCACRPAAGSLGCANLKFRYRRHGTTPRCRRTPRC
jgi:hypothetical protein